MDKQILSIGLEIPGDIAIYTPFASKLSLLDWDIIIIDLKISNSYFSSDTYLGKPCLSDDRSFLLMETMHHWKREILTAYKNGKSIIVLLSQKEEIYVATGENKYSGTGKNQKKTRMVTLLDNYRIIPFELQTSNSNGKLMHLNHKYNYIKDYWTNFEKESEYEVLIEPNDNFIPLITTKTGDKLVGGIIQHKESNGFILFLPNVNFNRKGFTKKENNKEFWTEAANKFGKAFTASLIKVSKHVSNFSDKTPAPSWLDNRKYVLPTEYEIRKKLFEFEREVEVLKNKIEAQKTLLAHEISLKDLLYEQGRTLEKAILKALQILGFQVSRFKKGDSEFDVVFESPEGRLIGEAEGKDTKAINIEKLRQLEMNINEDFGREDINIIAKGVLFGNPNRLIEPEKRLEFFTEKCIIAANRSNTALVKTTDLFLIAKLVVANNNEDLKKSIREHIIKSIGIVKFEQFINEVIIDEVKEV